MLQIGAPPPPKPILILGLDVIGGCCRFISAPKQHVKQHCFGGDEGLSSTISIYQIAIKHFLISFGEDCRLTSNMLFINFGSPSLADQVPQSCMSFKGTARKNLCVTRKVQRIDQSFQTNVSSNITQEKTVFNALFLHTSLSSEIQT